MNPLEEAYLISDFVHYEALDFNTSVERARHTETELTDRFREMKIIDILQLIVSSYDTIIRTTMHPQEMKYILDILLYGDLYAAPPDDVLSFAFQLLLMEALIIYIEGEGLSIFIGDKEHIYTGYDIEDIYLTACIDGTPVEFGSIKDATYRDLYSFKSNIMSRPKYAALAGLYTNIKLGNPSGATTADGKRLLMEMQGADVKTMPYIFDPTATDAPGVDDSDDDSDDGGDATPRGPDESQGAPPPGDGGGGGGGAAAAEDGGGGGALTHDFVFNQDNLIVRVMSLKKHYTALKASLNYKKPDPDQTYEPEDLQKNKRARRAGGGKRSVRRNKRTRRKRSVRRNKRSRKVKHNKFIHKRTRKI
jgi:hypothetical protein